MNHSSNGRAVLEYLLQKKGHNGHENRNEIISYINLIPNENVPLVQEYDKYWLRARKNHKCQMRTIWQSFSTNELKKDNAEDIVIANRIGVELAQTLFSDRQVVICTQIDGEGEMVHNHLAINDCDIYEYKACPDEITDWHVISKLSDEISSKYFDIDPCLSSHTYYADRFTHTETRLRNDLKNAKVELENAEDDEAKAKALKKKDKAYCWKDDIRSRLDKALDNCVSEDEYINMGEQYGVSIKKAFSKKKDKNYYLYELTDTSNAPSDFKQNKGYRKPKIRSYTLGPQYDFDCVQDIIENNKSSRTMEKPGTVNNDGSGSRPDISTCCDYLCDYAADKVQHRKYPSACFSSSEYYHQINQIISNNQMQINTIQIMMAVLNVLGRQKQAKMYQRMLYDLIDEQRKLKREKAQKSIEDAKRKAEHPVRRSPKKHYDIDEMVSQADELNQSVDEIKL